MIGILMLLSIPVTVFVIWYAAIWLCAAARGKTLPQIAREKEVKRRKQAMMRGRVDRDINDQAWRELDDEDD